MSSPSPPGDSGEVEYDPVFLNSRREAIIIFCLWVTGLVWAVPFCYLNGYIDDFNLETFQTIWGIPSWLFWGIAVPWLVADIFTTWFCFFYMADDDLGEVREGPNVEADIAETHPAETAEKPEDDA